MSTRTTERIVGAFFLLAFVVYMAGGELVSSSIGTTDVLSNIVDHQMWIAAGALLMLVNSAIVIGIGVLVFPLLKPHHETTAYAYLATRVFEAVMLAVGILFLLLLIPLGQAYVDSGFASRSLVDVAQQGNSYALHIGMIGLGIGGLLFCRALFRARLVPRSLAVLGIVGYPVLAAGEMLLILGYEIGLVHYALGGLFEIFLGVLLLVKGFSVRQHPQNPAEPVPGAHLEAPGIN